MRGSKGRALCTEKVMGRADAATMCRKAQELAYNPREATAVLDALGKVA